MANRLALSLTKKDMHIAKNMLESREITKKNPPDNRRVLCFKNKSRSDLLCDLSCLTLSSTEVIELSSSDFTFTLNFHVLY